MQFIFHKDRTDFVAWLTGKRERKREMENAVIDFKKKRGRGWGVDFGLLQHRYS